MDNHMVNWKDIWSNRKADNIRLYSTDKKEIFMELKRLTGNDTLSSDGVPYNSFVNQFEMVRKELAFSPKNETLQSSYFEVGCGTGALLFLLQQDNKKISVGGVDYSHGFINVAKKVIRSPIELYCAEASDIDISIKYDFVFSFSAFEYFYDYDYARDVMEKMINKANYSVAILDVHDERLSEKYEEYRRSVIPDYDEKYANLKKLFYNKGFFVRFAEEKELDIKITGCRLDNYWNAPFTYDVYFYKR